MSLPDHAPRCSPGKSRACSLVLSTLMSATNWSRHFLTPTGDFMPGLPESMSHPTTILGDLRVCVCDPSNRYSHSSLTILDNLDLPSPQPPLPRVKCSGPKAQTPVTPTHPSNSHWLVLTMPALESFQALLPPASFIFSPPITAILSSPSPLFM